MSVGVYYYHFVVVVGAGLIQTAVNIGCDCRMRRFAGILMNDAEKRRHELTVLAVQQLLILPTHEE